jgi:hypothetical protein
MYKITKKELCVLICSRKHSLGCSYEDAKSIVMKEYDMAEDMREVCQNNHKREYQREYSQKYRARLRKEKIKNQLNSLIPC